jgi:hypothetical protein
VDTNGTSRKFTARQLDEFFPKNVDFPAEISYFSFMV